MASNTPKRIKWHYLLLIPAIAMPLGIVYGLWIQDGGITSAGISDTWFIPALCISALAVLLGLQLLIMVLTWE